MFLENVPVRRPFLLALALSLMLHLAVLASPSWEVTLLDDAAPRMSLDATLAQDAVSVVQQPVPMKKHAPTPPPSAQPPRTSGGPQGSIVAPVAESVAEAPEPAPSVLPEGARSDMTEADAVPPAPTFAGGTPNMSPAPTFATGFAGVWPQRGRIRFSVTRGAGGFIVGQAEHRWQHDGTTYQLRAVTETVGIAALFKPVAVVQESRGVFVAVGLQPLEFSAERGSKPRLTLRLDPAEQRLFSGSGESSGEAMTNQTQDMLSLFYQLGALPPGTGESAVMVATGRKIERHTILLLGTLTLDTAFGPRNVQHFKLPGNRVAGAAHEESTEVWLDIATRLPLKIRHRDRKGEVYDQTATAVELDNPQ